MHAPVGVVPGIRPSVPTYPPGQAPLNLLNPLADYNPIASIFSFDQKGATSAAGPTPWIPTIQPVPPNTDPLAGVVPASPGVPSVGPMPRPITGNIYGPFPIADYPASTDPSIVYANNPYGSTTPQSTPNAGTSVPDSNLYPPVGTSIWSGDGITNDLTMDTSSVTA
jgi:hypothetical protein